ncbi:hypothetical protein J5N97_010416 [Dioscorea zingiberensis]|uniref:CCHC-type domain-containing protein n=1 Tax=Dioscorea zingiberensis TaxID=325984 RepID=A0A9D5CYN4_9LILI|nr:hypothetical protein J5N97_010416 [Dioscorea zingiberensis]
METTEIPPGRTPVSDVVIESSTAGKTTVRGGVPIQYPMLNDTNYGLWAVKMKILLRSLGVWGAIEGIGVVEEEKDQAALAAISQAVPDTVMMAIAEKETAKEAWDALKEMRVGEDRVKKARLQVLKRQRCIVMLMGDSETITEFSQKLTTMVGEMRTLGAVVEDNTIVEKLFAAVPDKFLPIVGTIEQWGDLSTMPVTEAIGRLRAFEESLKGRRHHKEEGEQLMLTRSQWESLSMKDKKEGSSSGMKKGGGRGGGRGRGRNQRGGRGDDAERKPYRKFDKTKIKCYNCNEFGHFASECSKPKREKAHLAEKNGDDEPSLLMIETCELSKTEELGDETVMLNEDNVKPNLGVDGNGCSELWYLDTGASNHMSGCIDVFSDMDTSVFGSTIKFGDGSAGGDTRSRICFFSEGTPENTNPLTGVYYIPRLVE